MGLAHLHFIGAWGHLDSIDEAINDRFADTLSMSDHPRT